MTELLLGLWQHLATVADTNQDARISEAEYKAAFAAELLETPESFDENYLPFLDALMNVVDTDGDDKSGSEADPARSGFVSSSRRSGGCTHLAS